ncbi:hypothetical protein SASPL_111911 [Salvia splendens]|uniref:Uncharacterized protein n=1 Tax=Salvia splendens TaxID=180675 RepID=A0A8X8Y787_SALSN|nr:hypothetical protein SASPL_111911 [Salvia splendens]
MIDGNKVVLSATDPDARVDDAELEGLTLFVTSTGEGEMKASGFIFSEIRQKFPIMPFSARALKEKSVRLGIVECGGKKKKGKKGGKTEAEPPNGTYQ